MRKEPLAASIVLLIILGAQFSLGAGSNNQNDWPMFNHDPEGSRTNPAEDRLTAKNVKDLKVLWTYPTAGAVAGTPAVVDDIVYAGDTTGQVYAVRRDGTLVWMTNVGSPVTASVLVSNQRAIVGDLDGVVHAIDIATGATEWSTVLDTHPAAAVYSSATVVDGRIVVGVGASYGANDFAGSVVALAIDTGAIAWKTYMISPVNVAAGTDSGGGVWSSPTYDQSTGTVYVTSGNGFGPHVDSYFDSVLAIASTDGRILWATKRPGSDFADSPQVYRAAKRRFVGAGGQNGVFQLLDAATGAIVSDLSIEVSGGPLGGVFADSAVARGVVYANTSNWPDPLGGGTPVGGKIVALSLSGDLLTTVWSFNTPNSPNLSGIAVANGVVYFQSALNGTLYALNAATGQQLTTVATGGQMSGPSVSRGQVYVGTGNALALLGNPTADAGPGAITALGVDKK